jgi:hypothetical protein
VKLTARAALIFIAAAIAGAIVTAYLSSSGGWSLPWSVQAES